MFIFMSSLDNVSLMITVHPVTMLSQHSGLIFAISDLLNGGSRVILTSVVMSASCMI